MFSQCFDEFLILIYEIRKYFCEVSSDIIVIYDVHQVELIVTFLQEFNRFRRSLAGHITVLIFLWLVYLGPGVNPCLESLIFPDLEGLVVNDGGLDNFFSSEYTPGDGINIIFSDVLFFIAIDIYGLVGDIWEFIEVFGELLN